MIDHPQILPCKIKEPQFFSRSWHYRVLHWKDYLALFPQMGSDAPVRMQWLNLSDGETLKEVTLSFSRTPGLREITGEASANTFAQVPPARLRHYLPEIRLILLLRDPVHRAFSHYRMFQRFRDEGRRLPFQMNNFHDDTLREIDWIRKSAARSYFIAPGIYAPRLRQWLQEFGKERILIIRTEDMLTSDSCAGVMTRVFRFLDLPDTGMDERTFSQFNVSAHTTMPDATRELLRNFYLPYNSALEELLNRQMHWDD